MRIDHLGISFQRSESIKETQAGAADAVRRQGPPATEAVRRSDQVQISDAGRALAAQSGTEAVPEETLSPERADQIRQRILQGAYNSVELADEVARRLLASGDLQ